MSERDAAARFWMNLGPRSAATGCREWTGHRHRQGYGILGVGGKLKKAHRVAWEIAHGPIPVGLCVLHACDNPPCAEVEHLWLGTQAENIADMNAKGRQRSVQRFGSRNPMARLTKEHVLEIRRLRKEVGVTFVVLGKMFGVSPMTALRAAKGASWSHV